MPVGMTTKFNDFYPRRSPPSLNQENDEKEGCIKIKTRTHP